MNELLERIYLSTKRDKERDAEFLLELLVPVRMVFSRVARTNSQAILGCLVYVCCFDVDKGTVPLYVLFFEAPVWAGEAGWVRAPSVCVLTTPVLDKAKRGRFCSPATRTSWKRDVQDVDWI
jgi:hypothetical protein